MKRLLFFLSTLLIFSGLVYPVSAAEEGNIQEEIIYSILVDRFNNGDQTLGAGEDLEDPYTYHGGDLQGIIDKLDSLKENGFTAIKLSPIMENTEKGYHGYWIEDFYQVEDQFGSIEDLKQLVNEAHERDIKVILELVTNYAADTHPMTEDPGKKDWYKQNNDNTSFPLEDHTVKLDQTNPEVQEFLKNVADFWIEKLDIDGYELHAADKANQDFLTELTNHIKETYSDFYLLGDLIDKDADADQLMDDTAIDIVNNPSLMPVATNVFSTVGAPVTDIYEAWNDNGRKESLNFLDSSSTERFGERVMENDRGMLPSWKLALTYLYTAPGTPMIYQGSEVPMLGEEIPENQRLVAWNSTDEDMEKFIGRVSALRSEFPALQYGDYELVGSSGAMSVFRRSYEGESVYIALNNDTESQIITLSDIGDDQQLNGLLGDHLIRANDNGEFEIGLPRASAEVYIVQDDTGLNWLIIVPVGVILLIFVAGVIYLRRKEKSGKLIHNSFTLGNDFM